MSFKQHFRRFLDSDPERLHFAAHSHHLWPDVTWDAHCQVWNDAASAIDSKWGDHILGRVVPAVQAHVARVLSLPSPATLALAPNTHELVVRLMSSLPTPARVLTTDSEFHSFARQCARWEESGRVTVERVAVEPFASFGDRFLAAAGRSDADLVFVSHVFFNSGFVFERWQELAAVAPERATVAVDAYHGFMALPTDVGAVADRVFYLAGGYKYAMSGEGACFMHCPAGYGQRPENTGWFAGFSALEDAREGVAYAADATRFAGSTFEPSGLYRMAAVMDWLESIDMDVAAIHRHVAALQQQFIDGVAASGVDLGELMPDVGARGHFVTFRTSRAQAIDEALRAAKVVVDHRADRLRFGFGLYHDPEDVVGLLERLTGCVPRD